MTASLDAARAPGLPFGLSAKFAADGREPAKTLLAELKAARHSARRARSGINSAPSDLASFAGNPTDSLMRPLRLKAHYYWINAALLALVAVGICGMWMIDQQRSDVYIRTLSARVAAETSLFSDPLTSDDHAWPVQSPTATDTASYHYAYGGYAMTGGQPGYTNIATADALYGDVALAVTARQIGSSHNNGVGLVARSLSANGSYADQIAFYISPTTGYWSLYHYQPGHRNSDDNWQYLDGGSSSAIHTGANATNRLLLVLRGTEYLCYINGQFVGRDVDSTVTP